MKDLLHYDLTPHNTFGIHAYCRRFIEYSSAEEAVKIASSLNNDHLPLLIIGAGSNLLLRGDFEGTVIHAAVKGREAVEQDNRILLRCGAGETVDDVIDYAVDKGWHGAENLSLIPGEVGASAVQNIGAYGVEVCEIIHTVEAVDLSTGEQVVIPAADCRYAYRDSRFKHEWKNRFLITHVTYRLHRQFLPRLDYGNIRSFLQEKGCEQPTARQLREAIITIRNEKLPDVKVLGNAGSFFVNPVVTRQQFLDLLAQYPDMPHYEVDPERVKIPAGWLIQQCGWKGRNLGRAGVYERQALILVNRGGATGEEIVRLCETIQQDVWNRFSIAIHPEVNIV